MCSSDAGWLSWWLNSYYCTTQDYKWFVGAVVDVVFVSVAHIDELKFAVVDTDLSINL